MGCTLIPTSLIIVNSATTSGADREQQRAERHQYGERQDGENQHQQFTLIPWPPVDWRRPMPSAACGEPSPF